jgi:hypothetical protein
MNVYVSLNGNIGGCPSQTLNNFCLVRGEKFILDSPRWQSGELGDECIRCHGDAEAENS